MKSYFVELTGINESRLSQEDICDELKANEIIVKAEYSLISAGTELSRVFALKQGFSYPVRPGYSLVGNIIQKGNDIKLDIGDRVFINSPHASIVKWHSENDVQSPFILKIDDDIDSLQATLINLGLVAIQGVNLSKVKLGYTVGIYGLGAIGILTALLYKKLGCKVIGLDVVSNRCKLAKDMGIDYVIDNELQIETIMSLTNNEGVDIAVDVTGLSNVIVTAINSTKRYGQVILLGSPRQKYETNITDLLSNIHMKNIEVIGAFNSTVPLCSVDGSNDSMMNNYKIFCDLIKNKDIDVSRLISNIVDPKDCQKAYYDLMYNKQHTNCIVFDWRKYSNEE